MLQCSHVPRTKISIDDTVLLEEMSHFNHLGCNLTYEDYKYMVLNINIFQTTYNTILQNINLKNPDQILQDSGCVHNIVCFKTLGTETGELESFPNS